MSCGDLVIRKPASMLVRAKAAPADSRRHRNVVALYNFGVEGGAKEGWGRTRRKVMATRDKVICIVLADVAMQKTQVDHEASDKKPRILRSNVIFFFSPSPRWQFRRPY